VTYYVWDGVGDILDMDGEDDLPLANTRAEALRAFATLVRQRPDHDWILWERNGTTARLIRLYTRP
jgi:hypothetical protein